MPCVLVGMEPDAYESVLREAGAGALPESSAIIVNSVAKDPGARDYEAMRETIPYLNLEQGLPLLVIVCAAQCYRMGVSVKEFLYAFPVRALVAYIILVLLVINGIYTLASKKIRDDVIVGAIRDDTV